MAKNLNLGNILTILRSNISKLQSFLKNRFHSNRRSYLLLTSGQKPKKSLEPFLTKISVSDFGLIWRPFREYLQIKNFFSKIRLCQFFTLQSPNFMQKLEKFLERFLRKTALPTNQPTNQLLPTTPILQDLADAGPKTDKKGK